MKSILVAADLQHEVGPLLARAAQLSAQYDAAVVVQHVIEDSDAGEAGEAGVREAVERHARETLDSLVRAARFRVMPTLRVEFGTPHPCVARAAGDLAPDVLLIGPGQPSTLVERVFGSTADRLVRTVPTPVLVVRDARARPFRRVAVAVDFSPLSEAALDAARVLAPKARLHLVHAYEVPLPFEQALLRGGATRKEAESFWRGRTRAYREQLEEMARTHAADARVSVLRGAPGAALVNLSRSGRVDLVALGTQGRNAAARALLGSVALRLLAEAGCDVLIVGDSAP